MAGVIVILIGCGFGCMLLWVGWTQFMQQRRLLKRVVAVDAVILESRVDGSRSADTDARLLRDNSTTSFTPHVLFTYEYTGVKYTSTMLYPTTILRGYPSASAAADELREYPAGAAVTAFINPEQPDKGFLRKQAATGPVVFLCVGVLAPLFSIILSRWA